MKTALPQRLQRRLRVRAKVRGSALRPRLSIRVTNRHIVAQIINDDTASTLAYVSTVGLKNSDTMTEKAIWVGTEIAALSKKAKVKLVVFDRGSKIYHGRLSALADAARKQGLEF